MFGGNLRRNRDNVPEAIKIGIWGPPKSGKTTYIGMLQFADRGDWKMRPVDEKAQDLFLSVTKDLRTDLREVESTVPGEGDFITIVVDRPPSFLGGQKQYILALPDCAGEDYENLDSILADELSRCSSIIWMVDPTQIDNPEPGKKQYTQMIQEWLYEFLKRSGSLDRLDKHMAFCLTKMDHPDYIENFDAPEEFALEKLGPEVGHFLDDLCVADKIRFFSTSSIGFNSDTKESNWDFNKNKLINPADPIGIFEPLEWLFSVV